MHLDVRPIFYYSIDPLVKSMTHTLCFPSWSSLSADDVSGCFFWEQAIALQNADCQVGVIYPCLYSLRDWRRLLTGPRGLHIGADLGVPTYRCHVTNWFPRLVGMVIKQLVHCGHRLFELYIHQHGMPEIGGASCRERVCQNG